jgi:hypothetical protein
MCSLVGTENYLLSSGLSGDLVGNTRILNGLV